MAACRSCRGGRSRSGASAGSSTARPERQRPSASARSIRRPSVRKLALCFFPIWCFLEGQSGSYWPAEIASRTLDECPLVAARCRRPVCDRGRCLGRQLVGHQASRARCSAALDRRDKKLHRARRLARYPPAERQSDRSGRGRCSRCAERRAAAHDLVRDARRGGIALPARQQRHRARLHNSTLGRAGSTGPEKGIVEPVEDRGCRTWRRRPRRDPEPGVDRLVRPRCGTRRRDGNSGRYLLGRQYHLYSRPPVDRIPTSTAVLAGACCDRGAFGGSPDLRGMATAAMVMETVAAVPLFGIDRDGTCLLGNVDGQPKHLGVDHVAGHDRHADRRHCQRGHPAGRARRREFGHRCRADHCRHRIGHAGQPAVWSERRQRPHPECAAQAKR